MEKIICRYLENDKPEIKEKIFEGETWTEVRRQEELFFDNISTFQVLERKIFKSITPS